MTEDKQTEYRSFEQKIFVDSGIKDFLAYFGKGFYGTVANFLKTPTFIRKVMNRQLWAHGKEYKSGSEAGIVGSMIGCGCGCIADGSLISYSFSQTNEGNYLPLGILVETTLLSGFFELGRFSKSKQEHLEVKAKLEAEKAQENLEAEVQTPQISEMQDERRGAGGGN